MTHLTFNTTTSGPEGTAVYEQLQTLPTRVLEHLASMTPEAREALVLALAGDRREPMPAGFYNPGDYVLAKVVGLDRQTTTRRCKVYRTDAGSNDIWVTAADLGDDFGGPICIDASAAQPFELI